MMDQRSFFGLREKLERSSEIGDPIKAFDDTFDFDRFRGLLSERGGHGGGTGRITA